MRILNDVSDFLDGTSGEDAAKIAAHLKSLEEDRTEGLRIKTLKGRVKELIVKQYRVICFKVGATWFVVDVFKKQSKKTPRRVIERAEKIYQSILGSNEN